MIPVQAVLHYLMRKENSTEKAYKADFSRLTSILLFYYYRYNSGWFFSPEQWLGEKYHPDYTISRVCLLNGPYYGGAIPHIVYELKISCSGSGVNWVSILDQMWSKCNAVNDMPFKGGGKMWAIGQIGFEICFFKFYLLRFEDSIYTNFEPLNLNNWTRNVFNMMSIIV